MVLSAQNLEYGGYHSRRVSHDGITILCDVDETPLSHLG